MYTKIFVVSLVQVALARHILDGISQLRNPEVENPTVHSVDAYSDGNNRSGHNERYVDNDNHAMYQNGSEQAEYGIQEQETPEATVNSQNANRKNRYIGSPDETNSENISVNHSKQRYNYRTKNQNNSRESFQHNQAEYDNQNTLKTNLDTQSNVSESSSNQSIEYNTQGTDSSHSQKEEGSVKTNETSNNNSDDSRVSQPPRTNLNIHSRLDNSQSANDSLPEIRSNGDSMVFIDMDNPKPNGPAKTTTDNELRYNTSDDIKDDKWVWDATTPTEPTTFPPKATGGDLDDRTSLNGDACPKGEAKVLGKCIPKHE